MRLVTFHGGFGRVEGENVVPMGDDMISYLITGRTEEGSPVASSTITLRAPVPSPGKIIALGPNYRDHARETSLALPKEPILFAKFPNSVIGHGEPIEIPRATNKVDYEAELAVVIGKRARQVEEGGALEFVAGYLCVNDVSARDLQFRSSQWTLGKAIDTFLPTGPWLVTPDEVGDPQDLRIRCLVNGAVVQDASTSEMVFGVAEIVSFISQTITLEPGDLIATGTPAGVGFTREPPLFLQPGDEVAVEIERIGRLVNPVQARA